MHIQKNRHIKLLVKMARSSLLHFGISPTPSMHKMLVRSEIRTLCYIFSPYEEVIAR